MPGPLSVGPVRGGPSQPTSAAPTPVDVSAISLGSAEFKKLPPAWQQAVRDAKTFSTTQLAGVSPPPKVVVTAAPSNGSAPVTVIVPAGAKEPFSVQTHYHGDGARALASNPASSALAKQLKAGATTVFVLPEANKPGAPTDWTNVKAIGATTAEALTGAGVTGAVGERTLSVHSAGGRALKAALEHGERLAVDHLVLQDALFESNVGRGVATYLKQHLPATSDGVGRITVVPSTGAGAAGLMKDLDEPALTRTQVLVRELKAAGRTVEVVPVATHDEAATKLRPSATPGTSDSFG